jgi:phenylalanine-4-hydroxylase
VEIQEAFAPAFHRAKTDQQREDIKRLAWVSTEFGLIRESGGLKVIGTGIISLKGEMEHILPRKAPLLPFRVETIINFDKATLSSNEQLFYFESPAELRQELSRCLDTLQQDSASGPWAAGGLASRERCDHTCHRLRALAGRRIRCGRGAFALY